VACRIAIVQGHPDAVAPHFCHALADAYAAGAAHAGHEVRRIEVAKIGFPLLASQDAFEHGAPPATIAAAQSDLAWAEHWAVFYPLWLGTAPALLQGFFEQALRPGFAFDYLPKGRWRKRLTGRSARIVVSMGMPAFFFRWFYRAHSLKALKRNTLGFVGIGPIRSSLIGMVASPGAAGSRARWIERMRELGARAR
jgi:putative NADPH-quinone reductase